MFLELENSYLVIFSTHSLLAQKVKCQKNQIFEQLLRGLHQMQFKDFRLSTKLIGGFSIVLILTIIIAYVGYKGLSRVTTRVEKSDDVNRLVKSLLETRLQEKNFIIRNDDTHTTNVNKGIKDITDQAGAIKDQFKQKINKEQMGQVMSEIKVYSTAFQDYVDLHDKEGITLARMQTRGIEALGILEMIEKDQKLQLDQARIQNDIFLDEKMANADYANNIMKLFLDARINEKEFINSDGKAQWGKALENRTENALTLCNNLKSRFKSKQNIEHIEKVISAINIYREDFQNVREYIAQRNIASQEMMIRAQTIMDLAESIVDDMKEELAKVSKYAELDKDELAMFLDNRLSKVNNANVILKKLIETQKNEQNFAFTNGKKEYEDVVREQISAVSNLLIRLKSRLRMPGSRKKINSAIVALKEYASSFDIFSELTRELNQNIEKMRTNAQTTLEVAETIRIDQIRQLNQAKKDGAAFLVDKMAKSTDTNQIIKCFMEARDKEKEFILSKGQKEWKEGVKNNLNKILELSEDLKSRFKVTISKEQIEKVITAIKAYDTAFNDYEEMMNKQMAADRAMVSAARQSDKVFAKALEIQKIEREKEMKSSNILMGIATFICIILGLFFSWFITRSITKPLNRVIGGLNESSIHVAATSGQVSAASHSLEERSSMQVVSIHEASTSLNNMSNITKQNADNAIQANDLMKEANMNIKGASSSVKELNTSMDDISRSSAETSKIIKTIDGIAFQTNLLALNAAIEAARAGEAGAGFAVVAEEVRNLSMRAAEAAKNTAELIDGTVSKINSGSGLVKKTNEVFSNVAESAQKVSKLVDEISGASSQ